VNSPTSTSDKTGFLERGGGWVVAQSVLMVLVLALGPAFPGGWPPVMRQAITGILFGLGLLFAVGGVSVLGRNRTIFPRPGADSCLIQNGVYRVVRHPVYTGVALLATAWAVGWGSWPTGFAALALFVFLCLKSVREEVWLRGRFPEYADYARRVRRIVPWVV